MDIIVRIRDLESVIEDLNPSRINLSVDLEGLEKGIHEIEIYGGENEFIGFDIIPGTIEIEISEEPKNDDEE